MHPSSGALPRRLALVVALVVGLLAAALPATAAPITKGYTAYLDATPGVTSVTVQVGTIPNVVSLTLQNLESSQQSFGSAQLTFGGSVLPTALSVDRAGWGVRRLSDTQWRVVNSGKANPVPPAGGLAVGITLPATEAGTTSVTTEVRQSNDFNGTNNDFTTTTGTLTIETAGPEGTFCDRNCTVAFDPSLENLVRADLTVTSSSSFGYTAGFTTDRLSCDEIPFGAYEEKTDTGIQPEPFQVYTDSTSPVSKKIVLTFPKALAVLVPDNGTPHHPVCAGGDAPFPGSYLTAGLDPEIPRTHAHEGLLLTCSDPAYAQAVREAGTAPFLPMCVQSRARSAGRLVVTIVVAATVVDPRFW